MTVKLDNFNTDFTRFLEYDMFNDQVKVVTETEVIKCSGILLSQHSDVLRDYVMKDDELFLDDNKHVRECLNILYGGSVSITLDNFQDILKFMTVFDIPVARRQILDWMLNFETLDLDYIITFINGSMVAAKAYNFFRFHDDDLEFMQEIYKPCRLFLVENIFKMILPDSDDERYRDLDSAMEWIISEVCDKKELITLLMHKDLIPGHLPFVKRIMDQSNYNILLHSLDLPDVSNAMSLCSRSLFEELFEKIEAFDDITFTKYKQLSRYKTMLFEKMANVHSITCLKESGSMHSSWRVLKADEIALLPTVFRDTSDQFYLIECLLSWISVNKSSDNLEVVGNILVQAILNLTGNTRKCSLKLYVDSIQEASLLKLWTPECQKAAEFATSRDMSDLLEQTDLNIENVIFGDQLIKINLFAGQKTGNFKFNIRLLDMRVKLSRDKIPEVSLKRQSSNVYLGSVHFYLYALNWKSDGSGWCKIPLYTEPGVTFQIISACRDEQRGLPFLRPQLSNIHFKLLCVLGNKTVVNYPEDSLHVSGEYKGLRTSPVMWQGDNAELAIL